MITAGTAHRSAVPWLASAAVAGIVGATSMLGVAWGPHGQEVFRPDPGPPVAGTFRLPSYPHLSHPWRLHHAPSSHAGTG